MAKNNTRPICASSIARTLLAIVLAVSLAPAVPAFAADTGGSTPQDATDVGNDAVIADMVSSGNYIEGEAIAIIRADEQPDTSAKVQQLAEVEKESVDLAADDAEQAQGDIGNVAAIRVQAAPASTYDVQLVVDHTRTTEQILRDLYNDPNVVAAEPNYSYEATEALEAYDDAGASAANALLAAAPPQLTTQAAQTAKIDPYELTNTGDLTGLQWAYGKDMSTADNTSVPYDKVGEPSYTLNVPGWTEGRTNADAPANASGTVCIMDMGLDPKHPDLKDVLYEFSVEQQREYGCGPYGYNASGDEYPVYTMRPSGEHGMHVAGIVASAWNGQGTSGVAHGVKLFGVNVFGGNGSVSVMSSVVKGFQFLVKAAKDVNLKAVNCSWGNKQTSFVLGTMINELGKQGVNTVIATGNDHENLDDRMELASQATNSPYAIRVNAAGPDGKPTMFTSYGQTATDVFAPGQSILSTYPVAVSTGAGQTLSLSRFVRFYPAGAGSENLIAYERFASATPGVRFFTENPALSDSANEIAPASEDVGYGDRHSVSIEVESLNTETYRKTGERQYDMQSLVGENGYVYLAIPVDASKVADAKWVSVELAVNNTFRPAGGVASLTYANANGPVEVDTSSANALHQGWGSGASIAMYQVQWHNASFFSDAIEQCVSEAHERIQAGEEFSLQIEAGTFTYKDPGVLSGLYGWKPQGSDQTYVIAKIALGAYLESRPAGTKLYIDEVAVGGSYAGAGAYANMSGTSMASPAVAGCLAVIAKDEPESSTLTDGQLEEEARERAAKLMASVDYDADLAKLCRTGGRVNLAANPDFAKKAPLVTRAESDGATLTVSGYFFGAQNAASALEIDGTAFTPSNWADERITVPVPSLARGSHVVKVTNADGVVSQATFSHAGSAGSDAALYEHDLALPTSEPAFNMQDRMWGSLAALDGAIYGITSGIKYQTAQGIWRYDIAKDAWSSVAMPDGYLGSSVKMGNMAAYDGSLYLIGEYKENEDDFSDVTYLWRYDSSAHAWARIDMAVPSGAALCPHKGKLFLVGGWYPEELSNLEDVRFALLDPEKRQITKVGEKVSGAAKLGSRLTAVSTNNNMYCYSWDEGDPEVGVVSTYFQRLTYDEKSNAMAVEDLSEQFASMAPGLAESGEDMALKAHLALAGLPDGVAVIGSKEKDADSFDLGHDTFVIYDDAKTPVRLDRTSTYQRAFDPMAVYYNGRLYAMGYSPAETHIAYFRATDLWDTGTVTKKATCTTPGERVFKCLYRTASYIEAIPALGHTWDAGKVTKKATWGVAGKRLHTCKTCGATKTVTIAALPGGAKGKSYKVAGNTYKVTSNGKSVAKSTVTLTKAKVAKNVTVPATVKIKGKTYKVTAIGAKAFAKAKAKLVTVTIGKNVKTIGKQAFASCTKLKKVKGGAAVATIGASAFKGCKVLASCAPLSSKKLAKIGATAFKGAKKLTKVTLASKKLKKAAVKNSLKGSSVKTITVKVGSSKANKTYGKKYKSFFAKKNSGKKAKFLAPVTKNQTM